MPVGALGAALRAALSVVPLARDLLPVRAARADRSGRGATSGGGVVSLALSAAGRGYRAVALRRVLDRHLTRHDAAAGQHADDGNLRQRGRPEREPSAGRRAAGRAAGEPSRPITLDFNPKLGTTGSAAASILRWRRTSSR